jgi:CDP-6-deoxy-D-xylo-4-hexulose-3-dehydrase|tara:strand:- start:61 stop:1227 length:1167 start_codon:yes stop_codon:yes gene_type:complete
MPYKFPLAFDSWDNAEKQEIFKVVESGYLTMGDKVKEFEQSFASYIGSKNAVMVNSGSSANLLMIASLFYSKDESKRLKRGDEVIVSAVSWSTTYFPLYQYGLKFKFVDIDIETLNFDLQKLDAAVTEKTRLILAVNLLGNPNDFDEIKKIIGTKNIILLEDNCEALGAEFKNKKTGTIGKMGTFSFYYSHHISTIEGGMIVTDDEELYQILVCIRSHGWTRNLPDKNLISNKNINDTFLESFRFVLPGYNLRPMEISGAVGIEQLKKFPAFLKQRKKNASIFIKTMKKFDDLFFQKEINYSSWFGFSIVIKPSSKRNRSDLVKSLNKIGFECRPVVAGNFANNEVIKYFDKNDINSLENANWVDKNGLFIGNNHINMYDAFKELEKL